MFNQDHGISDFDEAIELDHQLLHVCRVQSGRWFIKGNPSADPSILIWDEEAKAA
jgi:hypothetical protein